MKTARLVLLGSTSLCVAACGGMSMPTVRPLPMANGAKATPFEFAYDAGKRHLLADRPGLAVVMLERALAIDPGSVAALNAIGSAYDDLHRPDAANRYYVKALAIEPESADTLNNLAISAAMTGDTDTATGLFNRAAALDPKNSLIQENMRLAGLKPDRSARELPVVSDLVAVVAHQESRGIATAVSPKNAQGLMQVLPGTGEEVAQRLGVRWQPDLMTQKTPEGRAYNMMIGTTYLSDRLAKYGNQTMALAAYNAGDTRVDNWIAKYGDPRTGKISENYWISNIPFRETRKYVQTINAVMSDSAIKNGPTIERTGLTEYTLTIPVSPLS
jgi:soluble lytic murein transglycosylase-like protein